LACDVEAAHVVTKAHCKPEKHDAGAMVVHVCVSHDGGGCSHVRDVTRVARLRLACARLAFAYHE
jgi:hypothetical protein